MGYAMGNGEEWVDPAVMYTSQNARTMKLSMGQAAPKKPTLASGTKAKGKVKEVSWADELDHLYNPDWGVRSDIPTTVEQKRDPRHDSVGPRDFLTVNLESAVDDPPPAFGLEEHLKRAQEGRARAHALAQARSETIRPPYIDLFDSMQRLGCTGPFSKQFCRDRDRQDKQNLQQYREVEKHIESLYLWSGPLLGDGPKAYEKFGMCGLDWRETFDFLKAPSVGGRPTVPVSRMVPGGRMSRILVNDLLLQYSVPEADFLGNYSGGSVGVLGELGIQPISHTLSTRAKRIITDRTRLNGCFFFDYRGDVIPEGHQFDRMKPALDFGRKRQIMPLNNERNWQWLLGNFFTLPPSKAQRSGLQRVPSHIQLPAPLAPKQTGQNPVALVSYRPRQDLLHDIGNLVISVPLNQGRFECAWERFSAIRAKERRGPPDVGPGHYNQAKWYLLNCPIHRMRWIKSAVENIYKPRAPPVSGENKSGEGGAAEGAITQREAINFSRLLWLDICEELSTDVAEYPPEAEEVRASRIARNRASAILRNDKHCQEVKKKDPLDSLDKRNVIGEAVEKVLKGYGVEERSPWDKLATGWVINELLDDPDMAEICGEEEQRLEKDVELGRWVPGKETADQEADVLGRESSTSPLGGEGETYLVIQGCTLAGKSLYGTYAWSLFEDQSETKNSNQSCNLSSSNLEVRPAPVGFDSRYHDLMKVGITDDDPVPLSINQAKYQIKPVNCYASTPWADLGGVRELFTISEDSGGNQNEQKYIVVLALVTEPIKDPHGTAPKSTHPVEQRLEAEQGWSTKEEIVKPSVPAVEMPLAERQQTMSSEEERAYHHGLNLQHLQRQKQLLGGAKTVEPVPGGGRGNHINEKIVKPGVQPVRMSSTGQQQRMSTMSSEEERAYHEQLSYQHLQWQMQLAGGTQADKFNFPQSAAHLHCQNFGGVIPDPPPPVRIRYQNAPDFIPNPPPPSPEPTHVPTQLLALLGSGQYKVVAVYPSNKNCAYCSRVLDQTSGRVPVRCCRTERSGGLTSSMSQPSLKGGQFVHAKDVNALSDGCRCNEPKNFHELEMCFGHCGFCSEDCKERLDQEEQQLGSVWAKMNGFFEMQQEAKANRAIAERAAAWRGYEDNDSDNGSVRARREGTALTESTEVGSNHSSMDPRMKVEPQLCLNWPGGWTERGSLKRKRDREEREADVMREDKRSKMSNVKLGSTLGSVEYKVSEVFGGGWEGKLKKEGWNVPWFRSGEVKESVYNGVVGGRPGLIERLYGSAVAKW